VCDDVKDLADEIVEAVREGDPSVDVVDSIAGPDLTGHLNALFQRVETCLTTSKAFTPDGLVFDGYDLAIFDNNLTHLHMGGRLTAEAIVGYVRAFTTVPYIVSLNKNTDLDFDLRYLVGDHETRADVALNTPHLSNRALWTKRSADGKNGFAPWYWPKLQSAPDRRRRQIQFVLEAMDTPVFPALRFPTDAEAMDFLSPVARGTLYPDADTSGPAGKRIETVTFREVFEAWRRSIPVDQDRDAIAKAATDGIPGFEQIIARVVAGDVDHWLRRHVVAPQAMFVDLPHLLVRMPLLLGSRANEVGHWNAAAAELSAPFGLNQALYEKHLASAKTEREDWFPTPGFWWPTLKKDIELSRLFFAKQEVEWVNAVFCEDRSAFVELPSKEPGDSPVEFIAGFEGSWGQRHVARIPNFQYQPLSLLTTPKPA
jgi:hypothetical protein